MLLNVQKHFKSTELELVNERLQKELVTSKALRKMIEKLRDKKKRLETTTERGKDDGIDYGGQIKQKTVHTESGKQNFAEGCMNLREKTDPCSKN